MKSFPFKSVSPAEENSDPVVIAENGSFPIVAIGASAGGLEAYTDLLHSLQPDMGMAFVLVQHLDPSHQSLLADIISKATTMPVEEVKSGVRIRPNRVYVIPHNALMAISEGVFVLTPRAGEPGQHLAINFFMRSLAQEEKSRAIGIVLSGTGGDGTLGLQNIKAEGGITFAQAPASAKYDGMPRSAVDSGCVDFVLPPKEIAKELQRIVRHPYASREIETPGIESPKEGFTEIIDQLRKTSGVDFGQYKPNTIHRRALRRMVILKLDAMSEYAKYMREHPEEGEKLYDDVLIPVTSFFRDFEAFEALKSAIYPAIVMDKSSNRTIRIWAPGCSTGEETYSLAMTLLEFLGDKAASYQIQVFGTDLNEKGIQKARAGVYRESIAEEISPERLRRFFVKVEEGYRLNKAVREMCVFARHNLASDPPFSQMNLVACRNLLIYVQPVLQKKIIPILHYALKPSGFLVLGSSESVSSFPDLFSTVDKKHKIYAKKEIVSRLHYNFVQTYYPAASGVNVPNKAMASPAAPEDEVDVQAEADRVVLKHHAPVGVVVNNDMEVVQFRGRTTPYLEAAPGKASLNLLKMARDGLGIKLRTLIGAARKSGGPAKKVGVLFESNGHRRILNISVSPLGVKRSANERHFLVLFEDAGAHRIAGSGGVSRRRTKEGVGKNYESNRVKQELAETQDALRAAIESEEAIKDEFQSVNEEILSANEELQSTNEELETSKEELQSVNEELNTLNTELRLKNSELHELTNDVSNLLNSTRIPVVMLDSHFRIRRLTPNADKLLKAVPSDVGRPIGDIMLNIKVSNLEGMITKVLDSLQPSQQDVQDIQRRWHSLHILPYRTQDNKIDGVVLVLQDIDAIKSASEQLRKSSEFFRGIIDTVRQPLLVLDSDLRIMAVNQFFLDTFRMSSEALVNKFLYRLGEAWNIPRLRALLEQVLAKSETVNNFEVEHTFENIGYKKMLLNARTLYQANDREPMILLAIEDITERSLAVAALIKSEKLAASGRLAASLAHEINNPLQAVTNLMTLLETSAELNEQDRQHVMLAKRELGRVVHLVRQSLGFYRESAFPTDLNLEEVLESVLNLYKKQIEAKHLVFTKRYRVDGVMQSYPGEIRQMFSTLLVNAIEACSKGCRIALRARTSLDWRNPAVRGMRITLADTACGISPGNANRIFEPFFTTKGERGTGLGLWVTHGIVHRLGGSIRMRSTTRPGKSGTVFSVFVPHRTRKMDVAPSEIGRSA
jgi:two-component system, chemotaxis family, CheB/CheR fusion protein